ncbi:MAG TPA: diacylglycerol kinase family protein [Rhodothermales bacterium]|nr:diacylglycerol kinase family protein [Rhodothermales bacterium]
MNRRIHVIINPAAGQDRPVLSTLNRVFQEAGVSWDVSISTAPGQAAELTRRAVEGGADLLAAYGGDGTVMEVAGALIGSGLPLAIFPGGTANVMSVELGISDDLAEACAMVCGDESEEVDIDVGALDGGGHFILRVGIGLEADMVEGASREQKARVGSLAYAIAALKSLKRPRHSVYRLRLDGREVECEGVTCLICNGGSLGRGSLTLSPRISVRDGLLDVLVLEQADILTLGSLLEDVLTDREPDTGNFQHWQTRTVEVAADPPQAVQRDGEVSLQLPLTARVLPGAVKVLVPKGARILNS